MSELVWVFAYGSLLWHPEFPPVAEQPGRLSGYHRALCLYSWYHRGTRETPGLVLGLDRGGSCLGHLQAMPAADAEVVMPRLDAREMPDDSYVRRRVRVRTEEGAVDAWAYVVNRQSGQYAGKLKHAELLRLVRQGHGGRGRCIDYVRNTVTHLAELGVRDRQLLHLVAELAND